MAGKKIERIFRGAVSLGWLVAVPALAPLAIAQSVSLPPLDQPTWSNLSPEQRAILAPLANEWKEMNAFRRKKWLGIAARYPSMSPSEQDSVQKNMQEWARMAPEERKAAREKYKSLKKVNPEQRQAVKDKWNEYSALPQEERDRLKQNAAKPAPPKTPAKALSVTPPTPVGSIGAPLGHTTRSPISPLKPPQSTLAPKTPIGPPVTPGKD
jgi:hypothetical protein